MNVSPRVFSFLSLIEHASASPEEDKEHLRARKNVPADDSKSTCQRSSGSSTKRAEYVNRGCSCPVCRLLRSVDREQDGTEGRWNIREVSRRVFARWNKVIKRAALGPPPSIEGARRGGFYGEKPKRRRKKRRPRSQGSDRARVDPVPCPGSCYVGADLWPADVA